MCAFLLLELGGVLDWWSPPNLSPIAQEDSEAGPNVAPYLITVHTKDAPNAGTTGMVGA